MDRIVELALKELSVETSRDEALQMLKIILLIVPIGAGLLALATWSIVSAGGHFSSSHPLYVLTSLCSALCLLGPVAVSSPR
jgi:hypothetical protein